MKPEQDFKLMSLNGHHERQCAYLAALALNDNVYEDFEFHVVRIGTKFGKKNIPRFLRLVADALEEKPSKFDLTPTGWAIVKAWRAAYYLAGRTTMGSIRLWFRCCSKLKRSMPLHARKASHQPIW
jgi:hypothetical protein